MTSSSSSLAKVLCFEQNKHARRLPNLITYILSAVSSMCVGWQVKGCAGNTRERMIRILQEGPHLLQRVSVASSGLPRLPHT